MKVLEVDQVVTIHKAYLAGMIDSDGAFSISMVHKRRPNPTFIPVFQLTWTLTHKSKQFMLQLQKQYGGNVYFPTMQKNTYKNSKQTIKYYLGNRNLKKFIKDVLPYLILKK